MNTYIAFVKADNIITKNNEYNINCKNLVEVLKSLDYSYLENNIGVFDTTIENISDKFNLDKRYFFKNIKNIKLEITKTEYIIANKYIIYIKAGEYSDYYIPK